MSELLHWCYAVRQHSGIGSKSEAVLSVGLSGIAPECSLTFLQGNVCAGTYVRIRKSLFNILVAPQFLFFKSMLECD